MREAATPGRWRERLRHALFALAPSYLWVTFLLYAWHPVWAAWPIWRTALLITPQMVLGMALAINPALQRLRAV